MCRVGFFQRNTRENTTKSHSGIHYHQLSIVSDHFGAFWKLQTFSIFSPLQHIFFPLVFTKLLIFHWFLIGFGGRSGRLPCGSRNWLFSFGFSLVLIGFSLKSLVFLRFWLTFHWNLWFSLCFDWFVIEKISFPYVLIGFSLVSHWCSMGFSSVFMDSGRFW